MISGSKNGGYWGYRGRGFNNQSCLIFYGWRNTRRGGSTDRYRQKQRRRAADRSTGRIRGSGRGCHRCRNGSGDGVINGGDNYDGRGMLVSSCNARTRSGSRSIFPRSSDRKSSKGTASFGASTTRSRYGSRSGSVSRLRRRRMRGEQSGRSGSSDRSIRNNNGGNYGDDNIGEMDRMETM